MTTRSLERTAATDSQTVTTEIVEEVATIYSGPPADVRQAAVTMLRRLPSAARRIARRANASAEEMRAVSRSAKGIALLELRADAPWLLDAAAASWRGLHRVFAFLMVWSALLHVTVAFYLGYGF